MKYSNDSISREIISFREDKLGASSIIQVKKDLQKQPTSDATINKDTPKDENTPQTPNNEFPIKEGSKEQQNDPDMLKVNENFPKKEESETKHVVVRMDEQDIAKGIAMIFVIVTHSLTLFTEGGRKTEAKGFSLFGICFVGYIMPFYFLMSGYNYKPKPIKEMIKKRTYQLLLVLFIYSTFVWIFLGIYLCERGETNALALFKSYLAFWITDPLAGAIGLDASRTLVTQAFGPSWFVKSLYTGGLIFYSVAEYALENYKRFVSITFGLMTLSVGFSVPLVKMNVESFVWYLDSAPAIAAILLTGAYLNKNDLFKGKESKNYWIIINFFIAYAIFIGLQLLSPKAGIIISGSLVSALGPLEIYLCEIVALTGTYVLLTISRIVLLIPYLSKLLIWFGQNTLSSLLIQGFFLRIFCDIFDITGGPNKFTIRNFVAFVLSLVCIMIFLLIKTVILNKIAKLKKK